MFLYDYCLTVYDEIRYIWKPRRITLTSVTFILARYPVFASVILILLPHYGYSASSPQNVKFAASASILAFLFFFPKVILAVRTWAIWEKSRIILITLTVFSVSAIVPAAVVVAKDISTARVDPVIASYSNCRMIISEVTNAYVVPYVLTIVYEGITLTSSLIRITRWRKRIPKRIRAPLLDALWRDGVFYFSWTLALSFLNIAIIVQSSVRTERQFSTSRTHPDFTSPTSSVPARPSKFSSKKNALSLNVHQTPSSHAQHPFMPCRSASRRLQGPERDQLVWVLAVHESRDPVHDTDRVRRTRSPAARLGPQP
ncbi:hypothetical protein BDZ89DRAFT_1120236 [Hymenopellis radicata]|nr:hypothetical protein BDZ89DRAFT_1120236 [Hymenopellis radicata]